MTEPQPFKRDLDIATRELTRLRQVIIGLRSQLESRDVQLSTMQTRITDLETQLAAAQSRIDEADSNEVTMLDDLTAVRTDRESLREAVEELRRKRRDRRGAGDDTGSDTGGGTEPEPTDPREPPRGRG